MTWPAIGEHHDYIAEQLRAGVRMSTIHQRLRDERGLAASVASFRRYVVACVPEEARRSQVTVWNPRPAEAGEQAQIDYGQLGRWLDPVTGKLRMVWAFVMVLACSRHMFVRPVVKMDQRAWTECHVEAFAFFGGVPARLVPDYVPRNIFRLLCPAALCNLTAGMGPASRRDGRAVACSVHITLAPERGCFLQPTRGEEVAMLEEYFVKPDTVDRIRACWIGPQIERYVAWLAGEGYRPRTVLHRVPLLLGFAGFAWGRGARAVEDLPAHVEAFVAGSVARRDGCRRGGGRTRQEPSKEFRGPVEQMLELVVPGYQGSGRRHHADAVQRLGPRVLRVPERRARPPSGLGPPLPALP